MAFANSVFDVPALLSMYRIYIDDPFHVTRNLDTTSNRPVIVTRRGLRKKLNSRLLKVPPIALPHSAATRLTNLHRAMSMLLHHLMSTFE